MAVYKKTYRPYEGGLTASATRLFVITRYAMEDLRRSKFLNIFYALTFAYPLVSALLIYLAHNTSALQLINFGGGPGGGGPGAGYVDEFTPEGTLVLRLEHGDWMNAPWGLAKAPLFGFGIGFGPMSGRLLVGNLGSGQIASFNATSGNFEGMLNNSSGEPITISGLWGIAFGDGSANNGAKNELFFTAGPTNNLAGTFGSIVFVP